MEAGPASQSAPIAIETPTRGFIDLRILECPVCLDTFNDPRILTACGHTVCASCVSAMVDMDGARGCPVVECPSCRVETSLSEGVNGLAVNYATQDVIAGLDEDPGSYQSAFSWPGGKGFQQEINPLGTPQLSEKPQCCMLHDGQHEAPSPPANLPVIRKKRSHRRSLSCPGTLADLEGDHGEEPMVVGDGWLAKYKTPQRSQQTARFETPAATPQQLENAVLSPPRTRAKSGFHPPITHEVFGRVRANTERSSAWENAVAQHRLEHEEMMKIARESIELAEAMQEMELAEARTSFQAVRARHAMNSAHVAAPVNGGSGRGKLDVLPNAEYCHGLCEQEGLEDMDIPIFPDDDENAEEERDGPTLGGSQSYKREGVNSLNSHRGGVARNQNSFVIQGELEGRHTGEASRSARLVLESQEQERSHGVNIDGRRSNCGRRNPCANGRGGECCVGNGSWTNMLSWMGLMSDSVLH